MFTVRQPAYRRQADNSQLITLNDRFIYTSSEVTGNW
jgi:hypothetical protein